MLREGIVTRNELGNYVLTEKGKIIADEIVNRLEEVALR
jgi:Mn-dependent DtxR family transcriptional regulator